MNRALLISVLLITSGCTMMPFYHRPMLPVADQWDASNSNTAFEMSWRNFFKDERLRSLIDLSLDNNRDLRIAALNVEAIQAQYRVGVANGLPTIEAQGNGLRSHQPTTKRGEFKYKGQYSVGLGFSSYELDLFGRIRSLKAQALETYFASIETKRSAQISLVAQVAIQYLSVLQLDEEIALTQDTLKSQEANYDLMKKSFEAGIVSEIDLRSVEAQVQTAKVNTSDYQRQRAQAQDALVLLVGQALPGNLPESMSLLDQGLVDDLTPGLSSDLLQRRPDILEAEHQLKAANANIGAARAAFFPKITLTANGGTASLALSNLFTGPLAWSFNPQISMPIFDGGANKALLDLAQIQKRIEIANYEKTIQVAFREVADALAARSTYNDQIKSQEDLVKAQEARYKLAEVRYRNGLDSYLVVLSAQQDLYGAQQNLIKLRFNQLSNLITLYMVLGGGWS